MNQIKDENPSINDMVREAVAAAKQADELRGAAIQQLLSQREQIERDLKTLGYSSANGNGNDHGGKRAERPNEQDAPRNGSKRFKDGSFAEIGKMLISESADGVLHGKEIERLAKAGGFKGGTQNFQNYLPVAFKRAGGFENVGGNRWRLNENIAPWRPKR